MRSALGALSIAPDGLSRGEIDDALALDNAALEPFFLSRAASLGLWYPNCFRPWPAI